MTRKKISQSIRDDVISALNQGRTVRDISSSFPVSKSFVSKLKLEKEVNSVNKGGLKSLFTDSEKRYLILLFQRNQLETARELKQLAEKEEGAKVASVKTYRRILEDEDLTYRKKKKKILIKPGNKTQRASTATTSRS